MVLVELPIPAGFTVAGDDFAALAEKGALAKYQIQPTVVQVYLRDLPAEKPPGLKYSLRAGMPVQITVRLQGCTNTSTRTGKVSAEPSRWPSCPRGRSNPGRGHCASHHAPCEKKQNKG